MKNQLLPICLLATLLGPAAYASAPSEFSPDSIKNFVESETGSALTEATDRTRFGTVSLLAALLHDKAIDAFADTKDILGEPAFSTLTDNADISVANWQKFFSASVILIGNGLSDKPVIGYYNALADGLVLLRLERKGDQLNVLSAEPVTGTTLRGAARQRQGGSTPLPSPILANYQMSAKAFSNLFPAQARTAASARKFDHVAANDQQQIFDRLAVLENQNNRAAQSATLTQMLADFSKAAEKGDIASLKKQFPDDTTSPPEWVANLPHNVRSQLQTVAVFEEADGMNVALLAPHSSRLMVLLKIQDGEKPAFSDIILSDFAQLNRSAQ